jgi:hypothetical protein
LDAEKANASIGIGRVNSAIILSTAEIKTGGGLRPVGMDFGPPM